MPVLGIPWLWRIWGRKLAAGQHGNPQSITPHLGLAVSSHLPALPHGTAAPVPPDPWFWDAWGLHPSWGKRGAVRQMAPSAGSQEGSRRCETGFYSSGFHQELLSWKQICRALMRSALTASVPHRWLRGVHSKPSCLAGGRRSSSQSDLCWRQWD